MPGLPEGRNDLEWRLAEDERKLNTGPRLSTRVLRPVAVMALALALALPAGVVLASHQFSDVPNSNAFHADIDALVDADVTAGCGSGKYCPTATVTREQMAAFMNRLGALAPGKTPAVNADRLDGLDSDDFGVAGLRSDAGGTVIQWFNRAGGEPTISKVGAGAYDVTVPGRSFDHDTNFVATASVVGAIPGIATIDSFGGKVTVFTVSTAGVRTDLGFMLTIFDASASG
ncbi:MAG: S-layer homology domain-containing protein [Candidatus Limnocylindria bacterium]